MDEPARVATFPLTDLQEAYLVGTSKLIELGGFRSNFYFEFDTAGLDPARAEAALNRMIARHEQLRTVVRPAGGQCVLDAAGLPRLRIPVNDLSGLGSEGRAAELARIRARMLEDGPDPANWPLFRIEVSRIRSHRFAVHVAMSLVLIDAHSTWLLLSEWRRLHDDPAAELAPVALTFRECQQELLEFERTEAYQAQWRYWEDRLDSLPEAPALPLAQQPSGIDQVRFTRRQCLLNRDEWRRLQANCRAHRILPSAALAHVFAETLGAWAASPHFCLNVLHLGWMNRHPGWAGVVGQLGATIPLEVDLRRGEDFWSRGQHVQSQLWRDLEHSAVTGVRVMREAAARRGWSSRALLPYVFNSMLGLRTDTGAPSRPAGQMVASALRTPHVLIDNQVQDIPDGGIGCVWDAVDDAFPPHLPDLMFETYQRLLHELAGTAGDRAEPDPVPPAHKAMVAAINQTAGRPRAAESRLEDGFLRQVRAHPDTTAVITSGRTLTYRELDVRSRRVAAWLHERGIGVSDVVAVLMRKGWEQVAAVLGTLLAGAAYCPIDASLPTARISQLLGQCGARAVLTQSHSPGQAAAVSGLPELQVDQAGAGTMPPALTCGRPGDLAYVIYTSGSTGEPKGVMIEHRSACNTVADISRRIELGPADRVFGVSSLSFDLSVWDVFGTLAAGAALVLPDAAAEPDPLGWTAAAAAHRVSVWNSVPAIAEMLAEAVTGQPCLGRVPVRAFLLSGDWIPLALPGQLRRLWPDSRLVALGGATEAAIWSNYFEVGAVEPSWPSVPYGRPLSHQTMRVLDHRMRVRAPWATGRIYIGGAGLARGYLGDEQRTAERFVTDPVSGERLYWTGDLGRYWPDGTIELLGREDRQLKIQGFRVEPGEVESAIRSQPGVRECAVGAETAPGGQRRLVALAVPEPAKRPNGEAILAGLRDRLPHYMVPARVHVVDRLPLTANGKVDVVGALAALAAAEVPSGACSGPNGAARRTANGAARRTANGPTRGIPVPGDGPVGPLIELWAEVLQAPEAGPDSDFFALGGTSLLALRLVNRVRTELGADIPLGQVFQSPTPRALAGSVAASGPSQSGAVRLADGGEPELVLFHPVGGSVAVYGALARAWPGGVLAFQSPALTGYGANGLAPDLESMAAGYRQELQRQMPAGPYTLGGWSMGGVLAYEAGRQLTADGQRCCVFMIDSVPGSPGPLAGPDGELGRHLTFLHDLARGSLDGELIAAVCAASLDDLPRVARDAAVRQGLLPDGLEVAGYQRLVRVHADNMAALTRYRAPRADLPALLFTATAEGQPDPAALWQAVCPGIEVEAWPRDHYSIVAADLAPAMAARITRWAGSLDRAGKTPGE